MRYKTWRRRTGFTWGVRMAAQGEEAQPKGHKGWEGAMLNADDRTNVDAAAEGRQKDCCVIPLQEQADVQQSTKRSATSEKATLEKDI